MLLPEDASAGLTEKNLRTVIDRKKRQIIAVEDLDPPLLLAQAGVPKCTCAVADRPARSCDRIVFDIDPGEEVGWPAVAAAAATCAAASAIKLERSVKLSGGKGLHAAVPVEGVDWNHQDLRPGGGAGDDRRRADATSPR